MKIGILDYGGGNISNIKKAFNIIEVPTVVIEKKKDINKYEKIILPGMGSAPHAMKIIKQNKFDISIKDFAKNQNPIMGICLGFQLMLSKYEISKDSKFNCLSIVKGSVKKINSENLKLPLIDWHKIESKNSKNYLKNKMFYFAHQYYCDLDKNDTNATYIKINQNKIVASYVKKNLHLYQFHPELSGDSGLIVLNKFKDL